LTLPYVSVVIPAYNEEDFLPGCLESVIANRYPNFEIILVDDGSTDSTVDVASKYPVKVVRRESRGGAAVARNDGLRVAQGEIVAFIDADCTVDTSWLMALVSKYTDERIAGVGGIINTRQVGILAKYHSFVEREAYTDSTNPVPALSIPGGNSSYRTSILRKVGGFDPTFAQPRAHEIIELGYRLKKNGYVLIGEPHAIAWHSREGSLKSLVSGMFARGYSALSFLLRYKIGEALSPQLKQIAFIGFLIVWISALLRFIPLTIALALTVLGFLFEILRAIYSAATAVVKYRDLRFFVVIPIEIMLRMILYAGYVWAILMALRKGTTSLGPRMLSSKLGKTDQSLET
jgi:glycosyltransferase involved in cell wall biosynthesis